MNQGLGVIRPSGVCAAAVQRFTPIEVGANHPHNALMSMSVGCVLPGGIVIQDLRHSKVSWPE